MHQLRSHILAQLTQLMGSSVTEGTDRLQLQGGLLSLSLTNWQSTNLKKLDTKIYVDLFRCFLL